MTESPPTTQTNPSPVFDDAPIVSLLGQNPANMPMEQLHAFVQRIRSLRVPQTFTTELNKEAEQFKRTRPSAPKANVDLSSLYGI